MIEPHPAFPAVSNLLRLINPNKYLYRQITDEDREIASRFNVKEELEKAIAERRAAGFDVSAFEDKKQ